MDKPTITSHPTAIHGKTYCTLYSAEQLAAMPLERRWLLDNRVVTEHFGVTNAEYDCNFLPNGAGAINDTDGEKGISVYNEEGTMIGTRRIAYNGQTTRIVDSNA